jgi:large subunit ribosomal protein L10
MEHKSKAREKKESTVHEFSKLIKQYPVVGIVNMENLPSQQLSAMRSSLRGTVVIRMTKARLLRFALKECGVQNADKLEPYLKGMPAVLLTKESPFRLYNTLKKKKSKAPIKGGQKAPHDITIPAGSTPFAPGPVIGELGRYRIKTGVENGKVAIKADAVVAHEGDTVTQELAGLLTRLSILPMEIGLNLTAVLENGEILTRDVLDVDEDEYRKQFVLAATEAMNLAVEAAIPTQETIKILVQKAFRETKAVAIEANFLTPDTVGAVLAKAERTMNIIASQMPESNSQ